MLNILAQIGSMLGIPIFIYSVICPIYKNFTEKRLSKEKEAKCYAYNRVNELNDLHICNNSFDNTLFRTAMLEIFKKVLILGEVVLYSDNSTDKQIINMYFNDYGEGHSGNIGPMSVKRLGTKFIFGFSDNNFKNAKYKKYAMKHIDYLLNRNKR